MSNLPNYLTFLRIIIIPILISSFFLEGVLANWIAAALFVTASVTDFFDGYLARTLNVESRLFLQYSLGIFSDSSTDFSEAK